MIGSVLSRFFFSKDYTVCGIDNYSGGYYENIEQKLKNHVFPIDIRDANGLNDIFNKYKPNYVIHLAAKAEEVLSPFIRSSLYHTNIVGSANIINCCINHDVDKTIFFSSVARYGDGSNPPFKETDPICEKEPYALSKTLIEKDLKEAHDHFGLKYSIVVPFNVFSPFQNFYSLYRNVVAIFIRQSITGEDITLYGAGDCIRSFSDCQFLCEPVEKLLTEYDTEVFNLGSSNPTTIINVATIIKRIAQERGFNPNIVHLEPRREVRLAYCDVSKAERLLGFNDQTNLEKTINDMFDVAIKQPRQELKWADYEITKNLYSYWQKK